MATNSLLVRWANGWSEEIDAGAIAASERQEGYLQLGAAQSISEAGRLAIVQLSLFSDPRSEITTGIAPVTAADAPYLSFNIGDTVSVPDEDGLPTLERVLNLTVTEDRDTGRALFNPGLRDVVLEQQARVERTIKQMSNGTLSGISTVATPVGPTRSPSTPSVLLFPSNTPFIVVANDGTGDFDDPKAAIDSVAADVSTVIYVKNTDTNYVTGAVNLSGKRIVLWGESALQRWPSSGDSGPYWSLGVTNFTCSSSTRVVIRGMAVDSSATAFGMVAGTQLVLENANLGGGGTLRVDGGTTVGYKSLFGIHSTSFTGQVDAWDSLIALPNSTTTLTATSVTWHDCLIFPGGGSTQFTLAFSVGSSSAVASIVGCQFGEFAGLILSGWNQAIFTGNTNSGAVSFGVLGGVLGTLTCTGCDRVVLDSMMWGTTLVINGSQRYNLGGAWFTTTIAADGGSINATFDGDRGTGGTGPTSLVTVSGDHNVGSIYANLATTNGVLVSGDTNVLSVTATNMTANFVNLTGNSNKITTEVGATTADSGAGNVFL